MVLLNCKDTIVYCGFSFIFKKLFGGVKRMAIKNKLGMTDPSLLEGKVSRKHNPVHVTKRGNNTRNDV